MICDTPKTEDKKCLLMPDAHLDEVSCRHPSNWETVGKMLSLSNTPLCVAGYGHGNGGVVAISFDYCKNRKVYGTLAIYDTVLECSPSTSPFKRRAKDIIMPLVFQTSWSNFYATGIPQSGSLAFTSPDNETEPPTSPQLMVTDAIHDVILVVNIDKNKLVDVVPVFGHPAAVACWGPFMAVISMVVTTVSAHRWSVQLFKRTHGQWEVVEGPIYMPFSVASSNHFHKDTERCAATASFSPTGTRLVVAAMTNSEVFVFEVDACTGKINVYHSIPQRFAPLGTTLAISPGGITFCSYLDPHTWYTLLFDKPAFERFKDKEDEEDETTITSAPDKVVAFHSNYIPGLGMVRVFVVDTEVVMFPGLIYSSLFMQLYSHKDFADMNSMSNMRLAWMVAVYCSGILNTNTSYVQQP